MDWRSLHHPTVPLTTTESTVTMKPGHSVPLRKLRAIHSGNAVIFVDVPLSLTNLSAASAHTLDTKQVSYTLWFACKSLNRRVKRALGVGKANSIWLPQELVDCIVDYISDDRPTLFACTHLSRTWCISARFHLYRTFTVSASSEFDAVEDLQRMGMIHLVRRMVATRKINQADFLLPTTLTRLHAFTHLQELDIRYLDVGNLLLWLHEHCDILKNTVRTLTLRYPRGSIKQLVCFINLFSNLENLTVDSIDRTIAYDSKVPVIEYSPPLTGRLTLTGIFDPEFIAGLASMQKGVRFRTVDLQFCGEVQEIIEACAESMERLIYHPSDFRGAYHSEGFHGRF